MKASAINYLVDAGPLIALLDADDQWHDWSTRTLSVLDEALYTSETALAEACHHLRQLRPALLALIRLAAEQRLQLVPVLPDHGSRIGSLLAKYSRMDFGDATLVVLSELHPMARLITVDRRDFTIYRRKNGTPVPCIMPPSR